MMKSLRTFQFALLTLLTFVLVLTVYLPIGHAGAANQDGVDLPSFEQKQDERFFLEEPAPQKIYPILPTRQVSQTIDLSGCYNITFLGALDNGDGTSSWRYALEEQSCEAEMSNWVLELPECAHLLNASPALWETVNPDSDVLLKGLKWHTASGGSEVSEISIRLSGPLSIGEARVGAMGTEIVTGSIAGPVCDLANISEMNAFR